MYTPPNAPPAPGWFDDLDLREEPRRGRLSAETQPTVPTIPTALTCVGTNFQSCSCACPADTPPPEASATCNQP